MSDFLSFPIKVAIERFVAVELASRAIRQRPPKTSSELGHVETSAAVLARRAPGR